MLKSEKAIGFVARYVLVHLVTYVVCGIVFMVVSNYAEAFQQPLMADYMRPVDDPIVALGIPLQLPRGALLALALWPFRSILIGVRGWAKLWALLWVLTGVGAVITGPGSLEGMVYTKLGFGNPLIGLPEVTLQTLAFSSLLCAWERRVSGTTKAARMPSDA